MAELLALDKVTAGYGESVVLDDVSLAVWHGVPPASPRIACPPLRGSTNLTHIYCTQFGVHEAGPLPEPAPAIEAPELIPAAFCSFTYHRFMHWYVFLFCF